MTKIQILFVAAVGVGVPVLAVPENRQAVFNGFSRAVSAVSNNINHTYDTALEAFSHMRPAPAQNQD